MSIRIVVYGSPAPQGSKSFKGLAKSGRAILAESSKKVRPWRQDVKAAAEQVRAQLGLALLDEPLRVRMTFTLPKPTSASKRRVTLPSKLPDLSKLVRCTEDAITDAGVWRDDARVVECTAAKRYPGEGADALDAPGCVIEIERLLP
ncbi:RusA family crossover junction endodeoxyribonuclease [Stenotrophomonas sp. 169]|uniref:RusA family crossover junction endodeoxyribonuclease n=1 Tax=Stenotrophomonas sp. 169 TaxID=2770322 RepID=UPI0016624885|nr:RusA family crossover junction endodeoxyribonuclease [Stenotrophomonas sp. 169]QNR96010.1 RusA family crossover junction endodeoxyribonuclease [Stenotrophomonas sp. 169]